MPVLTQLPNAPTEPEEDPLDLMDEIDDALEDGGVRQEPVRKFLSEVRVSLDAARKAAEDLRAKQG